MTLKIQKKIEFDNECKCLVDYSELEKAILWYQKKPSLSKKKIYLHGRYPAVSIHNKKIHDGCDWATIRNRIYENPELLEGGNL